ncbi:MAG: Gfo/Idh/MocA family oxidoreductase [Firmicutes bacterium]|nr:Gfo/Idh/MocA family oxidoreductase [Bacillota bacterium]
MSERKVKIGIIGIGNMGTGHMNNILGGCCPELELTAVADINPARLDYAREKAPGIALFDNALAMLDSGLIEAVIIAVPHYYHPVYAIEAFKRKIHVMSEKPAGVYTKQVREMNEAAEKSGVIFGLMFNQRTNPVYRKMRELVQSGVYGEIRRTNWIITTWYRTQKYYDSGAWRATWSGEGGGVLLNQCPHQLDLWQWICGMPVKVKAELKYGKWHDIEVEDDVTAYCEYANGATGVFITSTGDYPGTNRFEVTLDRARILCDDGRFTVTELDEPISKVTYTAENGFHSIGKKVFEPETEGTETAHVGVLNAFAGAILHGTPLIANGKEGINGLTISNAMHLSSWLDKTVDIPFDEDLYYDELMKRVKTSRRKVDGDGKVADLTGTY